MPSRTSASPAAPSPKILRRVLVFIFSAIGLLVLLSLLAVLVMFAFGIRPATVKEVKKEEVKLPEPLVQRRVLHGTDPAPPKTPQR